MRIHIVPDFCVHLKKRHEIFNQEFVYLNYNYAKANIYQLYIILEPILLVCIISKPIVLYFADNWFSINVNILPIICQVV